jgi:hypothetical protein
MREHKLAVPENEMQVTASLYSPRRMPPQSSDTHIQLGVLDPRRVMRLQGE